MAIANRWCENQARAEAPQNLDQGILFSDTGPQCPVATVEKHLLANAQHSRRRLGFCATTLCRAAGAELPPGQRDDAGSHPCRRQHGQGCTTADLGIVGMRGDR